jgi:hypothetical protein
VNWHNVALLWLWIGIVLSVVSLVSAVTMYDSDPKAGLACGRVFIVSLVTTLTLATLLVGGVL